MTPQLSFCDHSNNNSRVYIFHDRRSAFSKSISLEGIGVGKKSSFQWIVYGLQMMCLALLLFLIFGSGPTPFFAFGFGFLPFTYGVIVALFQFIRSKL
jgi:hypothetical protein